MSTLVMVSNRLPVTIVQEKQGVSVQPSVGGVATGIASLNRPEKMLWFVKYGRIAGTPLEKHIYVDASGK